MNGQTIGFIGAGNIASAIFGGVTSSGYIKSNNIFVFDTMTEKSQAFSCKGAGLCNSVEELVKKSDFVFLAIKPQVYESVLSEIKEYAEETCFVSVAAGISIDFVKSVLGFDAPVIRAMPNTPLTFGRGTTALVKTKPVSDEQFSFVKGCFDSCGITSVVDEEYINTVTAVSGSMPAFVLCFANDAINFAADSGLDIEDAKRLVLNTFIGSSEMALKSDQSVEQLIKNVTSPNGTTEAGLKSLDANNFDRIINECLIDTVKRADELSK